MRQAKRNQINAPSGDLGARRSKTAIMKKVLILLLALGVIAAGVGYYMYNKPVASLEKKKADISITAAQLISDYEADEKSANDKYLGKLIEVSGKVADITTEEGKTKIQLETPNPISLIICEMETGKETGSIQAGDETVIKGMCSGYLSDVILVQATIVK